MSYGVVVSTESFVFTKFGTVPIKQLKVDSEVLGVQGIGKCTQYVKISFNGELKADAIRLITQTTDSILLPNTLVFSEETLEAPKLRAKDGVEFYCSPEHHSFKSGLMDVTLDIEPENAYSIGLIGNAVSDSPGCLAFLLRNATDPKYVRSVENSIKRLMGTISKKITVAVKRGKLGYLWIVLKGDAVEDVREILRSISPEIACMRLEPEPLKNYIAGMLDAYVGKPLYGGDPVLVFSREQSIQKRFLQSALICCGSGITETSCITSHAPKFLESTAIISKEIPVRNPAWKEISEISERPELFARVRGWLDVQTISTKMIFEQERFSPIVDGLYTYPSVLSE